MLCHKLETGRMSSAIHKVNSSLGKAQEQMQRRMQTYRLTFLPSMFDAFVRRIPCGSAILRYKVKKIQGVSV